MNSLFDTMLKMPVSMMEASLLAMKASVRTLQDGVETLSGHKTVKKHNAPPLQGPQDLDQAISAFANHLLRIARLTRPQTEDLTSAIEQAIHAARQSFAYLDLKDPSNIALPIEAALSTTGLLTEMALRGMAAFTVIGPKRMPAFVSNTVEMFSEVGMFVSLQYPQIIARHKERLARDPKDAVVRCELGRTYVKCGLYDHAVKELEEAAQDAGVRELAMHECSVAHFRAGRFEKAVRASVEALKANPENERARSWLWLSARSLGGYPEYVPTEFRFEIQTGNHPTKLHYDDVAAKIGLDKTSAGRGSAIFDYNNDGYMDVMIAAAHGGANLYRNNGDGTFTDVSIESGIDQCVNGFAITVGDYDNDGYPDLYVTRLGFYGGQGTLYHNNGDGTFTDVTEKAGVSSWGPAFTACWIDYDNDGFLDLFIANNLGGIFDRHVNNRLFHNNGDGTFTEVTDEAGLSALAPTIGSCWGDYNNDGYPDLFISSGLGRAQLFRNNGDGTFTEVSIEAGLGEYIVGSTCFFCDYDNDGWLDIVQFAWSDHEDVVHTMKTGQAPHDGQPLRIYHNNRNGTFTMKNRELGIVECWGTMSGNCADLNNDGHLDLMLGNGSPRMDRVEPLVVLENDGHTFRNVTFSSGMPFEGKSHGTNAGDLFGDGRMSIIVAAGGAYPGDLLTTSVYYPNQLLGNYLNVRLAGTKSNRSAIGARITIHAGGGVQMREVQGGTNFGCLPFEQHFGLGTLESVEAIEIRWPSGLKQRFENLPINDTIRIVEGQDGWEKVYQPKPIEAAA
jgi:tetratricopeptide (TPR) repeat protein